ncbi:Basic-leucine zipper domain [Arabidopsis thaliana x Arabidopsis arenosa]|uniref:Basic-leucine zipper domain n=1 Tax=Arabidopsis thaliana x Arabidopsis arenosa TaxID=1240361 RepID=A0A8T1ZRL0_9BRAS|nr:Basic-leucine zipper domain [Arabidopsis thaliana x Arabidopsis arenosa]
MAEPVLEDTSLTFSSDFDSITIPPSSFDNFCNSSSDQVGNSISDLRFLIDDDDGDGDFQFTSEEDLYFPSENESFAVPVDAREMSGGFTPASELSGDCVKEETEKNTNGVLISTPIYCDRESPGDSDCSGTTQSLSLSAQESAKRKKEIQEDSREESRNNKYRRLDQDGFASSVTGGDEEDDEKKKVRLIRNRESAHLSRQRKKHYVEELEDKQMGPRNGMCRPSMYPPLAPMAYPWIPYPAYMVKPQGSQVPLLPIPRLKPQQSVAKVKKFKKVASFSVVGLLFCLFLFCALAPIVNISYGEDKSNYVTDGVYDQSRGRVLVVGSNRAHCGGDSDQGVRRNVSETGNLGPPRNSSEPLVASLFVPRNEKLVKIDGNLIIHSVLASEKARDSETKNKEGKSGDTKPAPSMVVSVLVDPREGGDGDIDEMMGGTKSLSPVFIVLLVDDVKYVTYSCILPRPEVPHLVST